MLNFDAFEALTKDPDADMKAVIEKGLKERYGKRLPSVFADYLLESQTIKGRTNNCRGIQSTGPNIERMYYQILRYGPTVKNWQDKLTRDPQNVQRIIKENQKNMDRADAIVEEIKQYKGKIPDKAYEEFLFCFSALRDRAKAVGYRQNVNYLLWSLKDGEMKPDMATVQQIETNITGLEQTRLGQEPDMR